MNKTNRFSLWALITLISIVICSCGFDEGSVGRKNSKALREAQKYWKIKNETVVPLKELEIESGVKVTYSTDGINYKTIEIYHYGRGLEFHKLNYPEEEARIQKRYEELLKQFEKKSE